MRKTALLLLVGLLLFMAPLAQAANRPVQIKVFGGSVGGLYFAYCSAVAEIIKQHVGLAALPHLSAGSAENLVQVQRRTDSVMGHYNYGAAQLDTVYLAFNGKNETFRTRPAKDLRLLWGMYPDVLHIVAPTETRIKSVADLKGRKVSTGAPDSGTEMEALMVLEAAGLKPSDLAPQLRWGFEKTAEGMVKGEAEAAFFMGGLPLPCITKMTAAMGRHGGDKISILNLPPDSPIFKSLTEKLGGTIYPAVIGKSVYNTGADHQTVGVWNVMICHKDVPEDQAYAITKAVFEHLPELRAKVKAAMETNPANTAKLFDGPVPFHPGALRYFKEAGILK